MRYHVEIVHGAQRAIRILPARDGARVAAAVLALSEDPRPRGTKKLSGMDMWRLRVGEYRVLYTISDRLAYIMIERVERRTTTTYD